MSQKIISICRKNGNDFEAVDYLPEKDPEEQKEQEQEKLIKESLEIRKSKQQLHLQHSNLEHLLKPSVKSSIKKTKKKNTDETIYDTFDTINTFDALPIKLTNVSQIVSPVLRVNKINKRGN
jgi:CRISPR/Cas system CSM-associated protein Csm2 small subunit